MDGIPGLASRLYRVQRLGMFRVGLSLETQLHVLG